MVWKVLVEEFVQLVMVVVIATAPVMLPFAVPAPTGSSSDPIHISAADSLDLHSSTDLFRHAIGLAPVLPCLAPAVLIQGLMTFLLPNILAGLNVLMELGEPALPGLRSCVRALCWHVQDQPSIVAACRPRMIDLGFGAQIGHQLALAHFSLAMHFVFGACQARFRHESPSSLPERLPPRVRLEAAESEYRLVAARLATSPLRGTSAA